MNGCEEKKIVIQKIMEVTRSSFWIRLDISLIHVKLLQLNLVKYNSKRTKTNVIPSWF